MKVEIWSDVVCPWCYIGKRRFETALAQFAQREHAEIIWRSFELDPHAPQQTDTPVSVALSQKKGINPAQVAAMIAQVTEVAAGEGLSYHLERATQGNTLNAHRLIHLAAAHGLQGAAKERLLSAYFTESLPIGDTETLVRLGVDVGLAESVVRTMLAGDDYAAAVRADQRRAAMLGIRGVPFFVIDEQYGLSGAQPPEMLLQALEYAWAQAHPLTLVGAKDADGCDDGSCAI